jgi:hypothetical protein
MNLRELRNQSTIQRPFTGPLVVHTPYRSDNKVWLQDLIEPRRARWNPDENGWAAPRNKWTALQAAMIARYGYCYLVVERTAGADRCTEQCIGARGDECNCVCGGEFHGNGQGYDWKPFGDYGLIKPGQRYWWYCRLPKGQ